MAIYIPPAIEPWPGSPDEVYEAYDQLMRASLAYAVAYRNHVGIINMFSPKKLRRLKDARQEYHKLRDNYYEVLTRRDT